MTTIKCPHHIFVGGEANSRPFRCRTQLKRGVLSVTFKRHQVFTRVRRAVFLAFADISGQQENTGMNKMLMRFDVFLSATIVFVRFRVNGLALFFLYGNETEHQNCQIRNEKFNDHILPLISECTPNDIFYYIDQHVYMFSI